jgi:hemin uptake protein HemP
MKPAPGAASNAARTATAAAERGAQSQRQQISSEELFGGRREVLIEHAGELYSLRQTSKGKLILTK